MRDVAHHVGKQSAERPVADRPVKCRMAHAGADDELAVGDGEALERGDAVDVDEMRRLGEPKRHGRHQTLPAGQHAAVLAGDLRQNGDRLVDGFRRVVAKRRRLHRAGFNCGVGLCF